MKNKIYRLLSCIVLICILIGMFSVSQFVLRPNETDQCKANIKAFHELPENSLDVIFFGSSHGWRGIDPLQMYEDYGIGAYNYGGNWQKLSTEALFVHDAIRTQKPKVVAIETYRINKVIEDQNMDGEIYYTKAMSNFPYKQEYLKKAFGNELERYVAYYFPFSQLHSSWNTLNSENFHVWYKPEDFLKTMGYFNIPTGKKIQPIEITDPATQEQKKLSENAVEILDELVVTCKENDIELLFYSIPCEGEFNYDAAMEKYAAENDCTYIDLYDYNDEIGLNQDEDYMDAGHLNFYGVQKVSDFMGKYLKDNYELEDKRQVPDNLWTGKYGYVMGQNKEDWKAKQKSTEE